MKAILFFLASALLPCLANAQQAQRITGKVTDGNLSPIESGYNIILLSPRDSNLKQPMWYAYSGFDFTLPYGFKLNTTARYFTKGLENVFYFDPVFRLDAGIRKSFLNNKRTANIQWNDLFKTDGMNTYTTLNNRYIGYQYYFDRSVISLSLTYRFRSQKSKYQSRSSISPESERIKGLD
jgi:hypothetical protein